MNLGEINKGRVMHIDTSSKFYERKDTGIAYKIIYSGTHKGMGLSKSLKKELERDFSVNKNYAKLYAICIYYLIKDDLDKFDYLIICNDEDSFKIKKYLKILFSKEENYFSKEVITIYELRKLTGNKKLKSQANNIARAYRKRALKSLRRQQKGVSLNIVRINYRLIKEKWQELYKS